VVAVVVIEMVGLLEELAVQVVVVLVGKQIKPLVLALLDKGITAVLVVVVLEILLVVAVAAQALLELHLHQIQSAAQAAQV
jgi:hypothetical protein